MERTEMEPVTRTYCDVCGKDITGSTQHILRDETGEQHFCSEHNPRTFKDTVREYAICEIKRQPHMVPNAALSGSDAAGGRSA